MDQVERLEQKPVWLCKTVYRMDSGTRAYMGKADLDKGPVDLCPAEPVRMDANRGLVSEAGLRSETSIHGVSGTTIPASAALKYYDSVVRSKKLYRT